MTYPVELRQGIAQFLHDKGLGLYKPTGSYSKTETATIPGIVFGKPPITFDNCLVINVQNRVSTGRADFETPVQVFVRLKASLTEVINTSENIYDALHQQEHLVIGGLPIALILYRNGLYFEEDSNQRNSGAQTFYLLGRK